jgi:hypothetical protein
MANGSIVINLNGVTWNDTQMTFLIQGSQYVITGGQGVGVSGFSGATTVLINSSQAMLQGQAGNVSGTLHLAAEVASSDPTISMFGVAALPGTAMITWTQAGGGQAEGDLSQGTVTLTDFGAW